MNTYMCRKITTLRERFTTDITMIWLLSCMIRLCTVTFLFLVNGLPQISQGYGFSTV
uniref:Uncharacterized protein n=1 Tax=Octopus bimaculoides TaxID=37653 RepID=A0A0L8FH66_OCTBM